MSNFVVASKVEIEVTIMQDLLISVFEDGMSDWLRSVKTTYAEGSKLEDFKEGGKHHQQWVPGRIRALCMGLATCVWKCNNPNGEGFVEVAVDRDKLLKALILMEEKYPHHFEDIVNENWDATTAYVFGQFVGYEEPIYC